MFGKVWFPSTWACQPMNAHAEVQIGHHGNNENEQCLTSESHFGHGAIVSYRIDEILSQILVHINVLNQATPRGYLIYDIN